MYTVYALVDPRTCQIRYIGQTQNHPTVRLQSHLKKEDGNSQKWAWLSELKELGEKPNVVILEHASSLEDALYAERYWIERGRKTGWPLLNFRLDGKRRRRPVTTVEPKAQTVRASNHWDDVVAAWFSRNPQALMGPALGISDLARAMCVDAEGTPANYEAYKGRAHKLFHEFRNAVRLPGGERLGTDVSWEDER